ncbi:MAG: diguanylate cyclase [Desulfobacteraceae bacterium]
MIKTAVIEDSKALAGIYRTYLAESEFDVMLFGSNAEEITRLAEESGVEIVVYPGFPKFQFSSDIVSRLKKSSGFKSALFVLSTTMPEETMHSHLDFNDIDGLLIKPFQKQDLYRTLSEAYHSRSDSARKKPLALVVDDSAAVQRVLSQALSSLNFMVKTASNGAQGLKLALEHLPDLIVTDVEMPVMNGFELCKNISVEPSIQNVPVIVVSGKYDDAEFRKGFESGVVDFLKKPVSQAELFSVIESVAFDNLKIPMGTALVASSDPTLGGIVVKILKSLQLHVNQCRSLSALETFLKVAVPNIIVLDLSGEPEMVSTCRHVKGLIKGRSSVVITVAEEKDKSRMVKCFKCGADEMVTKPFGRDELKARIKNHMKIKKLQEELIQKNRILESLAYKDKLTGLMNRRFFDDTLKKELANCEASGLPLAFMIMDLDNFKPVNDTYGHDIGDTVLREIAGVVRELTAEKGIACRYGGEEFCVVFPGLDLESAMEIGEEIRRACSERYMTEHGLSQTISGGISVFPGTSSKESLVIDADTFLYRAKQSGKNRILSQPG